MISVFDNYRTTALSFLLGYTFAHQVVSHCPEGLPPTIVAPLLTPQCVRLMSDEASAEEDQLWQSLGDAWNIPRWDTGGSNNLLLSSA